MSNQLISGEPMRLKVLIILLFLNGYAMAQKPTDVDDKSIQYKVEESDSSALLAHKKAESPDANQVKVIIKKNQIVEEYRHKGELVMVKVIPNDGVPYYIDPQARNKRTGAHSDLINSGVEPVQWVIKRF